MHLLSMMKEKKVQEHCTLVQYTWESDQLVLDAVGDVVQISPYAHWLRNLWTNLAPVALMNLALRQTLTDPMLLVDQILNGDSSCQPVTMQERASWYAANSVGDPRGAWPTIMLFPGAHTFQGDQPGLVFRHSTTTWDEPSLNLRREKGQWASNLVQLITSK